MQSNSETPWASVFYNSQKLSGAVGVWRMCQARNKAAAFNFYFDFRFRSRNVVILIMQDG